MQFRHGLVLLVLALSACTGVAVKEPVAEGKAIYLQRAGKISEIRTWSLAGKISLDDGEQGGSGRLRWDVSPDSSELDFHGAMGRGAWHLHIGPDFAVLTEANGTEQTATSVDDLVHQRIGWPLPVDALQWWVRGLRAPGAITDEQYDAQGLLIHLEQFGWNIDINRYKVFAGQEMPIRLDARRGEYRVKMAIGRWQLGSGTQD